MKLLAEGDLVRICSKRQMIKMKSAGVWVCGLNKCRGVQFNTTAKVTWVSKTGQLAKLNNSSILWPEEMLELI